MIRFIHNYETQELITDASGNLKEVVSDIAICVNVTYNLLRDRDPGAAHDFQRALCAVFAPGGPVWTTEDVPDPENGVKLVRVTEIKKEGDPT